LKRMHACRYREGPERSTQAPPRPWPPQCTATMYCFRSDPGTSSWRAIHPPVCIAAPSVRTGRGGGSHAAASHRVPPHNERSPGLTLTLMSFVYCTVRAWQLLGHRSVGSLGALFHGGPQCSTHLPMAADGGCLPRGGPAVVLPLQRLGSFSGRLAAGFGNRLQQLRGSCGCSCFQGSCGGHVGSTPCVAGGEWLRGGQGCHRMHGGMHVDVGCMIVLEC
jgi:hypothetical protein